MSGHFQKTLGGSGGLIDLGEWAWPCIECLLYHSTSISCLRVWIVLGGLGGRLGYFPETRVRSQEELGVRCSDVWVSPWGFLYMLAASPLCLASL